jgi:hypothetical protein
MIAGKRPILTLSTRVLLIVPLALAFGYVLSPHSSWHALLGTGVLITNVVFIGCALIDYVEWQKSRH